MANGFLMKNIGLLQLIMSSSKAMSCWHWAALHGRVCLSPHLACLLAGDPLVLRVTWRICRHTFQGAAEQRQAQNTASRSLSHFVLGPSKQLPSTHMYEADAVPTTPVVHALFILDENSALLLYGTIQVIALGSLLPSKGISNKAGYSGYMVHVWERAACSSTACFSFHGSSLQGKEGI